MPLLYITQSECKTVPHKRYFCFTLIFTYGKNNDTNSCRKSASSKTKKGKE